MTFRITSAIAILAIVAPTLFAQKTVQVKGYYRKDGVFVQPHVRSAPGAASAVIVSQPVYVLPRIEPRIEPRTEARSPSSGVKPAVKPISTANGYSLPNEYLVRPPEKIITPFNLDGVPVAKSISGLKGFVTAKLLGKSGFAKATIDSGEVTLITEPLHTLVETQVDGIGYCRPLSGPMQNKLVFVESKHLR